MSTPNCIFCDIIAGTAPASVVYSDDNVVAFMDIQPVNPGHMLVVPRNHAATLSELHPPTGAWIFRTGMKLAGAVRNSNTKCEGVNLMLADGEAAGQEVFHVHLHVVPRFHGDGFGFRFGPNYWTLPDRTTLDTIGASIRDALERETR